MHNRTLSTAAALSAALLALTACTSDADEAEADADAETTTTDLVAPDLIGEGLEDAEDALAAAGLDSTSFPENSIDTYSQDEIDDFVVYETDREAGTTMREGQTMSLCVAPQGQAENASSCFADSSEAEAVNPAQQADTEECSGEEYSVPEGYEPAGWPQGWEEGDPLPDPDCHPDFIALEAWEHHDAQCMDPIAHGTLATDEELEEMGEDPMAPEERLEAEWEASEIRAWWSPPAEGEDCYGHDGR